MRTGTNYWTGEILRRRIGDATSKLLLLALADHIDANDEAFPSIARLADEAETSVGTARRRLADLEKRGLLSRERRMVARAKGGMELGTYTYRLLRDGFAALPAHDDEDAVPARNLRGGGDDSQRAPQRANGHTPPLTPARTHGERAEPPNLEPPIVEPPNAEEVVRAAADDAPRKLCEQLADRVAAHMESPRPAVTDRWVKDMRLLIERGPLKIEKPDPIPPDRIERCIAFVSEHLATPTGRTRFCWASQIRSPHALRDHWPQLYLAAREARQRTVTPREQRIVEAGLAPRFAELLDQQRAEVENDRRLALEAAGA